MSKTNNIHCDTCAGVVVDIWGPSVAQVNTENLNIMTNMEPDCWIYIKGMDDQELANAWLRILQIRGLQNVKHQETISHGGHEYIIGIDPINLVQLDHNIIDIGHLDPDYKVFVQVVFIKRRDVYEKEIMSDMSKNKLSSQ
jgi:hypothetical protein